MEFNLQLFWYLIFIVLKQPGFKFLFKFISNVKMLGQKLSSLFIKTKEEEIHIKPVALK
jgi:hypothetical protein